MKFFSKKANLCLALLMAVAVTVWMLPATGKTVEKVDSALRKLEPAPFKVEVQNIEGEMFVGKVTLTGTTKAQKSVNVLAQTSALVEKIYKQKGDEVTQGEVIVSLEDKDAKADLLRAQAAFEVADFDLKAQNDLFAKGLSSTLQSSTAKSNFKSSQATLINAELELGYHHIRAPFSGTIEALNLKVGNLLSIGNTVFTINQYKPVLIETSVGERDLESVKEGMDAKINVLYGQSYPAKVTYVSKQAREGDSRTFDVELELSDDIFLEAGRTVNIEIFGKKRLGYKVPMSALVIDSAGYLMIKAVQEGKVIDYPVKILDQQDNHFWLSGLKGKVDLITVGQGFVSEGDAVSIQSND